MSRAHAAPDSPTTAVQRRGLSREGTRRPCSPVMVPYPGRANVHRKSTQHSSPMKLEQWKDHMLGPNSGCTSAQRCLLHNGLPYGNPQSPPVKRECNGSRLNRFSPYHTWITKQDVSYRLWRCTTPSVGGIYSVALDIRPNVIWIAAAVHHMHVQLRRRSSHARPCHRRRRSTGTWFRTDAPPLRR